MINPEAEDKFNAQMREEAYNAFLQLRGTLSPKFNGPEIGYKDADHARLTIVQQTVKRMDKMAAEHLRKNP